MSLTRTPLSVVIALLLMGLIGNTFFFHSPILGTIFLIPLATLYSIIIGSILYKSVSDIYQPFSGFLTLLTSWIILGSGIYYMYGITKPISLALVAQPALLLIWTRKISLPYLEKEPKHRLHIFYTLFAIAGNIALLTILFQNQTADVLISPWHAVSPWFFLVYALTAGFSIAAAYTARIAIVRTTLITLFLFTSFSVASIIYPIGYGFDAFVHRATEMWIQANGFILPKQPYYIGQYSFVTFFSNITSLPIKWVDIFLVPILAARTLSIVTEFSLEKIFNIPKKLGVLFTLLIPFLFYFSLHLTTPHNLVLLFSILAILLAHAALHKKITWILPFLLATASLVTHPLLGAPLFIFIVLSFLTTRISWQKKYTASSVLLFLIISLLLPTLFLLQQYLDGHALPTLANPFTKIPDFLALITRPYWYAESSPLIFELLYVWQWLITPVIVLLAIIGLIKNKAAAKINSLFIAMTLGLIIDAWILRSVIVFPNVILYEQGDYPLRLLKSSLLFLLPFAMYGTYTLHTIIVDKFKNKLFPHITLIALVSILLTLSFYFAYPQKNPKARFPGFNVTASDVHAVQWIHDQHAEYNYIVLANQLVSAAALTEYSFAKHFNSELGELFYYSVPTGGPLYKYYGKMIYEGQKREYMTDAMNLAGVDTAYFIVNKYWANSEKIIEGAKLSADEWREIDNGNVWVFVYKK